MLVSGFSFFCMCVCAHKGRRGSHISWSWMKLQAVGSSCGRGWEMNPGPLQGQPMLLTGEPSLRFHELKKKKAKVIFENNDTKVCENQNILFWEREC